jgi:hypothetical protein
VALISLGVTGEFGAGVLAPLLQVSALLAVDQVVILCPQCSEREFGED